MSCFCVETYKCDNTWLLWSKKFPHRAEFTSLMFLKMVEPTDIWLALYAKCNYTYNALRELCYGNLPTYLRETLIFLIVWCHLYCHAVFMLSAEDTSSDSHANHLRMIWQLENLLRSLFEQITEMMVRNSKKMPNITKNLQNYRIYS